MRFVCSKSFIFYSIMYILLTSEIIIFQKMIGGLGPNFLATFIKCSGDTALILFFYWILGPKLRIVTICLYVLVSLIFLANSIYYRFWGTLIDSHFWGMTTNIDSSLFSATASLLRWIDLFFVIAAIIVPILFYYLKIYRIDTDLSQTIYKQGKVSMIILSGLLFCISQITYGITIYKQLSETESFEHNSGKANKNQFFKILFQRYKVHNIDPLTIIRYKGFALYIFEGTYDSVKSVIIRGESHKFDAKDIKEIYSHIESIRCLNPENCIFKTNHNKNIIVVIVESLNAQVVGMDVNGNMLTPTLNHLIESPGSISCLNVVSQVRGGCSSDGQILINTGLLPLNNGVTSIEFINNSFPALPKILENHSSTAILGDQGSVWNERRLFDSFGFKHIYSEKDYVTEAKRIGNDKAMFNFGSDLLNHLKQPFLLEFVTCSSHVPFNDEGVEIPRWLIDTPNLSSNQRGYFAMINYFDKSLGEFINTLKNKKIWENTILIIASDHCQKQTVNIDPTHTRQTRNQINVPIVFIAANCGATEVIDRVVGQVNIYPTILQIAGIHDNGYRGLGRSILDHELNGAVTPNGFIGDKSNEKELKNMKEAWRISDLIHRGNYFDSRIGVYSDN